MSARLIFIRRSCSDIDLFGGEVFADIDSRRAATIGTSDVTVEVPLGIHKIKMYKSHAYNTCIGFAEVEVNLSEEEALTLKYSPPMTINLPGNIVVSDFVSYSQIDQEIERESKKITTEKIESDNQKRKVEEESNKNIVLIIILAILIPAIIWMIYDLVIINSI